MFWTWIDAIELAFRRLRQDQGPEETQLFKATQQIEILETDVQ
jgi:hypothetical protein